MKSRPLANKAAGFLMVALAMAATAVPSLAGAIHVSPLGDDATPGTLERPVATIQRAVDLVADRDGPQEIVVHEGVYEGDVTVPARENPPPLTIRAAEREGGGFVDAILDGSRRIEQAEAVPGRPGTFVIPFRRAALRFENSVWEEDARIRYRPMATLETVARVPATFILTGDELYFHTSDGRPPEAHRLHMASGHYGFRIHRDDVAVQGLQFRHFILQRFSTGVSVEGENVSGVVVEHCRVWNARRGVSIGYHVGSVRVARLRADDVGNGVFTYGVDTVVEDSQLFRRQGPFEVQEYGQDQSGFQSYHPGRGGEARGNLIVGFNLGVFFKGPASRYVVEHNTVVGTGASSFGVGCAGQGWHPESAFRYNIVAGFRAALLGDPAEAPGAVVERNCLWQPERGDRVLANLERDGAGTGNVNADPMFADPDNMDFRLCPGSPAANIGPGGTPIGALGVADEQPASLLPPVVGAFDASPSRIHPADEILPDVAYEFVEREDPPRSWHVHPLDGSDDPAEGTEERPLKSLQLALNLANPGDRVVLQPGIYLGSYLLGHGGTEDAPIVVEASGRGHAVLDGLRVADECLALENAPHVTVRGLEIRGFMERGIRIEDSPNVSVLECEVWNSIYGLRGRGVGLSAVRSPGLHVERSLFYALGRGFHVWGSPNFRMEHLTVTEVRTRAAGFFGGSVAGSVFRNNSFTFTGNEHYVISASEEDMATFDCDYNNLAMHVRSIAPRRPAPEEDIEPIPGDWYERKTGKGIVRIRRERLFSLREWQEASGKDMNSIFKHPRYVDPGNRDFRLLPDSPNIGAGKEGATIGALGVAE